MAIYTNNFCKVFAKVLAETGVTCYKISQYSGLDGGYLSRLKSGLKENPSPETVIKICIAIAHYSKGTEKLFSMQPGGFIDSLPFTIATSATEQLTDLTSLKNLYMNYVLG
ncbi:hypothetical protein ACFLU8_00325 [Chloroflexota bacterium]